MEKIKTLSIILSTIFIVSCSITNNNCICTLDFISTAVTIIDQNNNPVDSLTYQVIDKSNGITVKQLAPYDSTSNVYPLLNDSYTAHLSSIPKIFLFEAHKGNISIKQDYLYTTGPCKCHITKFAGPDTIVVNL